ncbi:hypothetical protein KUD11_06450 [Roseovarius sp. LXJ103]|uniref:hypothetical protein n=1 Tax=Roseovarius carneus TaxID=2853164 RepID=UPI000D618E50|nr:hypothetical protein [Roseovarius carneus]MBZ8118285.1 hypothetical protein [Roseovarius carneus]PWE35993.1 hypothetical protein DD563_08510 [Pelagicola sp. LXJ1103]
MRLAIALGVVLALSACGVDGAPIRPAVTTTFGTSTGNTTARVTTDWVNVRTSTHVGVSL